MLKRLTLLAGLAAVATFGAVAVGIGGGNPKLPSKTEVVTGISVHPVATPAGARALGPRAAGKRRGVTVRYFESADLPMGYPEDRSDLFAKCPRKFTPINGYFGSSGKIFADYLALGTRPRSWEFGVVNMGDPGGAFFIGIVCLK